MPNNTASPLAEAFRVSQQLRSEAQRKHWSARLRSRTYTNAELEYIIQSLRTTRRNEHAEANTPSAPQLFFGDENE